jgi:hypothetical protein
VLVIVIATGWFLNDGDISWGRLNQIPYQEVRWFHVVTPLVLLAITWMGIPVSTSFLVLAVFSSSVVLEAMMWKSFGGLLVGAVSAFALWLVMAAVVRRWKVSLPSGPRLESFARIAQAVSTMLLWSMWLVQDMSNIAVYLPREMPLALLLVVLLVLVAGLGVVFRMNGGAIQHIVKSKTNLRFVVSATIVDLVYAAILFGFKQWSDIPMSTTWVFVGILAGREAAIRTLLPTKQSRKLLPMLVADLSKLVFGASVSVGIAFFMHDRWDEIVGLYGAYPLLWAPTFGLVAFGVWANHAHHVRDAQSETAVPRTTNGVP